MQHQRLRESDLWALTRPGRYADGNNLYLVVDKALRRRWVFLYRFDKKRHEVSLGGIDRMSLAEARARAAAAREALDGGLDPFAGSRRLAVPTFGELAHQHINEVVSASAQPKHVAHWNKTLFEHAQPICALPVDKITTTDVVTLLQPHWLERGSLAKRIRANIEKVLDVAKARQYRTGDNPATWHRHLENLLPAQPPSQRRASIPWEEIPALVRELSASPSVEASCLFFAILTAAFTTEVAGSHRREFDLGMRLWKIPAVRSPAALVTDDAAPLKRLIPLSQPTVQLLNNLWL